MSSSYAIKKLLLYIYFPHFCVFALTLFIHFSAMIMEPNDRQFATLNPISVLKNSFRGSQEVFGFETFFQSFLYTLLLGVISVEILNWFGLDAAQWFLHPILNFVIGLPTHLADTWNSLAEPLSGAAKFLFEVAKFTLEVATFLFGLVRPLLQHAIRLVMSLGQNNRAVNNNAGRRAARRVNNNNNNNNAPAHRVARPIVNGGNNNNNRAARPIVNGGNNNNNNNRDVGASIIRVRSNKKGNTLGQYGTLLGVASRNAVNLPVSVHFDNEKLGFHGVDAFYSQDDFDFVY